MKCYVIMVYKSISQSFKHKCIHLTAELTIELKQPPLIVLNVRYLRGTETETFVKLI